MPVNIMAKTRRLLILHGGRTGGKMMARDHVPQRQRVVKCPSCGHVHLDGHVKFRKIEHKDRCTECYYDGKDSWCVTDTNPCEYKYPTK